MLKKPRELERLVKVGGPLIIDVRPGVRLGSTESSSGGAGKVKTKDAKPVKADKPPKAVKVAKPAKQPKKLGRPRKELTYGPQPGRNKIGDWTIIRRVYKPNDKNNIWWRVECVCGNQETLRQRSMLYGSSPRLNCGCKKPETPVADNQREYHTWQNMLARCYDPTHPSYERYGGRGIGVVPEWRDKATGFRQFLADMGPRPSDKHSIDRNDPNKDYGPNNPCTWETVKVQNRNKENTVWVTDPDTGNPIKAADLADKWGVRYQVMRSKLMRMGLWNNNRDEGLKE
jgi:hypothetical protein